MRRIAMAVSAAVVVLAAAGCSSDEAGEQKNGGKAKDPTAAAVEAARVYQEARNDRDWRRICAMQTDRYRDGTVEACVAENSKPTPTPSPSSTGGPDRADTGPVKASSPVPVAAIGEHPAGTGVQVEFTVTWPTSSSTSREALRLVQQGDTWLVDQAEDIFDSDIAHGNPVHDALMRG